jgi:hypothetical protein
MHHAARRIPFERREEKSAGIGTGQIREQKGQGKGKRSEGGRGEK